MSVSLVSLQPTAAPSCNNGSLKRASSAQSSLNTAITLANHMPKPLNPDRITLQAADDTMPPLVSAVGTTLIVGVVALPIVVVVCKFACLTFSFLEKNLSPW